MNGIQLPENIGTCFSALGNAVNVDIVRKIASRLIKVQQPINGKNGQVHNDTKIHVNHATVKQC